MATANDTIGFLKTFKETIPWTLLSIICVLVATTPFDYIGFIVTICFFVPPAVAYGLFEYRYAKFRNKPENEHSLLSLRSELFWLTFMLIAAVVSAYFAYQESGMFHTLLIGWAFSRAWYFLIWSTPARAS